MKRLALWLFLISSIGISSIGGIARAADDAAFELVLPDRYNAMLRDGGRAYDRKDYAQAFELNRRTACAGDKTSQAIVGRMYVLGQGTPRDELTGYGWIKLAAEFGFAEYTSLAHKLEGAMTPERRTQANARAEAMHKNYGLVATGMSCHGESRHGVYIIDAVVCTPPGDGGMVRLHRCLDAGVN